MDYGYVVKKSDDWFIVLVDLKDINSGYGVVPRTVDAQCKYDIDDVRSWCEANPDKVYTEHPMTHSVELISEKQELEDWLKAHDYVGTKIATGRATIEDYASVIEEMKTKASRIAEINKEMSTSFGEDSETE